LKPRADGDSRAARPARRSRQEERKQQTRAELIAAAATVFARHGFHGASLEQIAAEAGYSTGAVYWHFKGKDDLFLAVYEAQSAARVRDIEEFRERAAEHGHPRRARDYADQFMARLREDPEFMVLTQEFLIHAWRNPPLREAFSHRIAWGREAIARVLEEDTQRTGARLPLPAEDLATVLRELGVGLGLAKLADPDAIPEQLFGDFVEVLFELIHTTQPTPTSDPGAVGRDTNRKGSARRSRSRSSRE
jgi:AcrR family transcriptional regulator